MKHFILLVLLILLCSACGPTAEEKAAQTATADAFAWTPTLAATATSTSTPSSTPTITPTSTQTPTLMPTPQGGGLIAVGIGNQIHVIDAQGTEIKNYDARKDVGNFWVEFSNNEHVAFTSEAEKGVFELVSFDFKDSESTPLVGPTRATFYYTKSPDNLRLAYCGEDGLYLVNLDGTGKRKMTDYCGCDLAWSPTENQIVFEGLPPDADQRGFFMLDIDSGKITPFTNLQYESKTKYEACNLWWSPSGKFIGAYYRYSKPNGNTQIDFNIIPVAEPQQLYSAGTGDNVAWQFIGWLPDDRIVTVGLPLGADGKLTPIGVIMVTNASDKAKGNVIYKPDHGWEYGMMLSPDQGRLAFMTGSLDLNKNSTFTPNIINTDGTNQVEISETILDPNQDYLNPVWSPDGKYILFRNFKDKKYSLVVADVKTGEAHPIYTSSDAIHGYVWLPLPGE